MYYALIIMAAIMPILTIAAFIIGYNINTPQPNKIFSKPKKTALTVEKDLLARIDKAHI